MIGMGTVVPINMHQVHKSTLTGCAAKTHVGVIIGELRSQTALVKEMDALFVIRVNRALITTFWYYILIYVLNGTTQRM